MIIPRLLGNTNNNYSVAVSSRFNPNMMRVVTPGWSKFDEEGSWLWTRHARWNFVNGQWVFEGFLYEFAEGGAPGGQREEGEKEGEDRQVAEKGEERRKQSDIDKSQKKEKVLDHVTMEVAWAVLVNEASEKDCDIESLVQSDIENSQKKEKVLDHVIDQAEAECSEAAAEVPVVDKAEEEVSGIATVTDNMFQNLD